MTLRMCRVDMIGLKEKKTMGRRESHSCVLYMFASLSMTIRLKGKKRISLLMSMMKLNFGNIYEWQNLCKGDFVYRSLGYQAAG